MPSSYTKNRTSKKPHLLRAGGLAAEINDLRGDLQSEVSGSIWSLQSAWAIDPILGRDSNLGTPAFPIKTMAEFNDRLLNIRFAAVAALQLVGDVLDEPLTLQGTRFRTGASLTVNGTVTTIGTTATIATVTALGPAGVFPWQLDTTGIDWTTVPVGSRLALSNGTFGFIRVVNSSSQIVVGALTALNSGGVSITPTAAMTIVVQQLSRALPHVLSISIPTGIALVEQGISFDSTSNFMQSTPAAVQVLGCEIKCAATSLFSAGLSSFRACRFSMTGSNSLTLRSSSGTLSMTSCVFAGGTTGSILPQLGSHTWTACTITGAQVTCASTNGSLGLSTGLNISHTTTALRCDGGGVCNAGTAIVAGTAGTGIGVDIICGAFYWTTLANRPVITGSGGECRVGGVAYTYANLGNGKTASLLDAIPPTVTTLTNADPGLVRGPGIAVMAQSS